MADKALPGGHAGKRRAEGTGSCSVNARTSFNLLNPSGDLASTQAAFEDWFAHEEGWKGKAGEVPSVDEVMEGLLEDDLFIYFGHGSGEQYLYGLRIRRLDNCAAALLMSCGSGRLAWRGNYDPVGVPLSYLMAGCPTAIAKLWDVTDGDIDRFSRVFLHSWFGFSDGKGDEETKECHERTGGAQGRGSQALCYQSGARTCFRRTALAILFINTGVIGIEVARCFGAPWFSQAVLSLSLFVLRVLQSLKLLDCAVSIMLVTIY